MLKEFKGLTIIDELKKFGPDLDEDIKNQLI